MIKKKEIRDFATNTATGQYHLNLHVLYLNYNSTYTEMIKTYRSMSRRFHPDYNYGFDTTEMMTMINTAKDGFLDYCVKMIELWKKKMSKQQKMWNQFHLITILIQNQVVHRPNQQHNLLKNQHYQLNTLMIMKNHP